jgi:flotillin
MFDLSASFYIAAATIVGILATLGTLMFVVSRYRRCPANRLLVISGKTGGGNAAKTISGGGSFVWPVIQEYAYMDLTPMQINIPLRDALSYENIRVAVPSVFTVAIGTDAEVQQNAAIRLLGLRHDEIVKTAQDIIFGQLRQVIASMRIEEINRDRDAFLQKVTHSLEPELKKIGLVLLNVNITDLKDDSGYIEAIGRKAASQAVNQARGDVAEQDKLGQVRVADAEREQAVAVANASKVRDIGVREAQREQAVRLAELTKEQAVGEQTAAFERDAMVAAAERQKRVAVAEANAQAIAGESMSAAEVAQTQAALQVKQAESFQMAETRRREAEAAVQEAQHRALARAATAEAERIEAERRAQLEGPARAEKARRIVEAEAEAEQVRIKAEAEANRLKVAADAEAQATFAKLDAQARGEYEILSKRAEAIGRMVAAAGGDPDAAFRLMMVEQMPLMIESAAKAISNLKFDKVIVWDGGNGNGEGGTAGFVQNMVRSLPPMMSVIEEVGGVKLPDFLGKRMPEVGANGGAADLDAPAASA